MDLRESAFVVLALAVAAGVAHFVLLSRIESRGARLTCWIVLGVLLRVAFLPVDHGLSDDFHRYVWEGRVVLAGENPYLHAPDDPALAALRDDVHWPHVTHAHVPAAYPPLAMACFAIAAATPSPLGFLRALFVGAEFLAWLLLARLLEARGLPRERSFVFGLAPVVILEYAGSFHFDSLAIAATVSAFLLAAKGRSLLALIAIAIATLLKPYAIVLAPLLLRAPTALSPTTLSPTARSPRDLLVSGARAIAALGFVGLLVACGYAPFVGDGLPLDGLLRYTREWSFNAPIFPALRSMLEGLRNRAFDGGWNDWPVIGSGFDALVRNSPDSVARAILALLFSCGAMWIYFSRLSRERAAAWVLALLLLLAPTIQPWYVTWFLPFVAFEPRIVRSPLFLWACLAPLGYHVLPYYREFGVWVESPVWRIAQYAPVLLWTVLLWTVARAGAGASSVSEVGAGGGATPRAGNNDARLTQ